jgi:hypothetical protein
MNECQFGNPARIDTPAPTNAWHRPSTSESHK